MFQNLTVKSVNYVSRILDLLGRARDENDAISSDALRIASLEAARREDKETIKQLGEQLARSMKRGFDWKAKYEAVLESPIYIAGLKRKAGDRKARGRA